MSVNWYYDGKEHDYGDTLGAYLVYITDGMSYLIDPFVTEERFFDFLDEKYGGGERIHMIIYDQFISDEIYERLSARMSPDRIILP